MVLARPDRCIWQVFDAASYRLVELRETNQRVLATVPGSSDVHRAVMVGQDIVYSVWNQPTLSSDFSVLHWSAATGRVKVVGGSERDASGGFIPTPWIEPVAIGSWVYWAQTTAADPMRTTIFRYEPSTGKTTTGAVTYGAAPAPVDGILVQLYSDSGGGQGQLRGLDVDLRPTPLPSPLDRVVGARLLKADGRTLVWVEDRNVLGSWRSQWGEVRRFVPEGLPDMWEFSVDGDVVTFLTTERTAVANLETKSWLAVTKEYGGSWAEQGWLYVGFPAPSKGAPTTYALLRVDDLSPFPAC